MFRFGIIICLLGLTACNRSSTPQASVHEITGSTSERVAGVTAIIAEEGAPPTAIQDAHFVEEQIGDGQLGPADARAFCLVEVMPEDVSQWTQTFTPLGTKPQYAAPAQARDWWIDRNEFDNLEFYKPDALTRRIHGWIGVSQQTGRIYIFTFSM